MSSQPISYVKAHLAEVIDAVRESHEPLVITQSGAEAAVLQDLESFERTQKALRMLKLLALGEADAREGRLVAQDDVFRNVRAALGVEPVAPRKRRQR